MNTTQALATVLKLMVYIREENSIDGIELPDTVGMSRKDFDLIGDTVAQCCVDLKREEHPELGKLMQGILDLSKGKTLEADEE